MPRILHNTYAIKIILSIRISICNKNTYLYSKTSFSFVSRELKGKEHQSMISSASMLSAISECQERGVLGAAEPALKHMKWRYSRTESPALEQGCVTGKLVKVECWQCKSAKSRIWFRCLETFTVGLFFSIWNGEACWAIENEQKLVLLCTCNFTWVQHIGWYLLSTILSENFLCY